MKILYYLSYNNYYNRLLKRKETVEQYINSGEAISCGPVVTVNFFPNDGIATTQTAYLNQIEQIPDYLLVTNDTTGAIESRWFVVECQYNTGKTQYVLSLYRDVIADWWNDIANAPLFCEKGWVSTLDSAIYNSEAITTNQIKKDEQVLKDATETPWIVGYVQAPKDSNEPDREITIDIGGVNPDIEVDYIQSWEYFNLQQSYVDSIGIDFIYNIATTPKYGGGSSEYYKITTNNVLNHGAVYQQIETPCSLGVEYTFQNPIRDITNKLQSHLNSWKATFTEKAENLFPVAHNPVDGASVNGMLIKDKHTNIIYKARYETTSSVKTVNVSALPLEPGSLTYDMSLAWLSATEGDTKTGEVDANSYQISANVIRGIMYLDTVQGGSAKVTISKARYYLQDAPYCMFAIPYETSGKMKLNGTPITMDKEFSLNFATALTTKLGGQGGFIYDIQLVPYCPIIALRNATEVTEINTLGNPGQTYSVITVPGQETVLGVMFWAKYSSGTFNISTAGLDSLSAFTKNEVEELQPLDFKVKQQTTMLRLCSPNYNGVFEFSPYKNRGVDKYVVNYTYKPYQPFIQIYPDFGGLYGKDFQDGRGLILGGDFSLPIMDSAWDDYEIQNKNYQAMFNRQIENLETKRELQRTEQKWGIGVGALSAGATGAMMGSVIPGIGTLAGMGIGFGLGAVASLAGGAKDYQISEALYNETIDYTRDQFGYQLDNIRALPNSLTRISSLISINKLFPYVEVYDCTEQEKQAVRNKIIYNGMTIGRVGTVTEFSGSNTETDWTYVKGQLIRLTGIIEDSHVINTIAKELNKGVFINNEYSI